MEDYSPMRRLERTIVYTVRAICRKVIDANHLAIKEGTVLHQGIPYGYGYRDANVPKCEIGITNPASEGPIHIDSLSESLVITSYDGHAGSYHLSSNDRFEKGTVVHYRSIEGCKAYGAIRERNVPEDSRSTRIHGHVVEL